MSSVGRRNHRLLPLALIASLLIAMSIGPAVAQEGDATLRVVHAVHGAGAVDVYINGDTAIEGLDYSEATEYLDVPAGDYNLRIVAAGDDPEGAFVDMTITLASDTPHTAVAIGPVDAAQAVVIVDDHTAPPDGMAKLSLINATSDGVEVTLTAGDESLVGDVPSADASEYAELEVGAFDLTIRSVANNEDIATLSGFSVDSGGTYSVFALGVEGDYDVVALVDAGAEPTAPAQPTQTPTAAAGGSTPEAETPTPGTTATTGDDATSTPVSTATPTQPASTPTVAPTTTVIPSLPDTGSGGTTGGGLDVLPIGAAALVVLLTCAGIWRLTVSKPGTRG